MAAGPRKKPNKAKPPGASSDASKDSSPNQHQQVHPPTSAARGTSSTPDRSSPSSIPRLDGNRDTSPLDQLQLPNFSRVEGLGVREFAKARGISAPSGCLRPSKPCSLGTEILVRLNTYHVLQFPSKPVYQFDINVMFKTGGLGEVKRGALPKIWNSKMVQNRVGKGWLWDGNRAAWSLTKTNLKHEGDEFTLIVDLNAEKGKKSTERNTFKVSIRFTRVVNFTVLNNWLNGRTDFGNECIEALSFLDHLMRESPAQKFAVVRKSFFSRDHKRNELSGRSPIGSGVEARKGVFSSIRSVHTSNGPCLSINVDVANCCFYTEGDLKDLARKFLGIVREADMSAEYIKVAKPLKDDNAHIWRNSRIRQQLKRLHRVKIVYTHQKLEPGKEPEVYCIKSFLREDASEYSFEIEDKDGDGNVISKRKTTVAKYFLEKYKLHCRYPLPLVQTTKGDVIPMDVCKVVDSQRYPFKLDDIQTSDMIKFAVTLPEIRWEAVQQGLEMLAWKTDPYLHNYGLKISENAAEVKARLLPCPSVQFRPVKEWNPTIKAAIQAGGKDNRSKGPQDVVPANRAQSGRWDLMGIQFILPNKVPLKSWGVMVVNEGRGACVSQQTTTLFLQQFVTAYRNHGGNVANPTPLIMQGATKDGGEMISQCWNAVGVKTGWPQLLVFIVPSKNADLYKRIKKSCDCRYGVVSQVMLGMQVEKKNGQYISNVLMKVNAKLGGATSKAVGMMPRFNPKAGTKGHRTAIIGADVSHAAPGSDAGSMAAITLSMDKDFMRYNARCNTNGHRVEMITTRNIEENLYPMLETWIGQHDGYLPDRILYLRDGVSEGQYNHVLDQEVKDMKALVLKLNPKAITTFTVVIAAKRHHIRFFPRNGDRNGNPKPGTLVDTGCTHPFEFDWYLCAHSAIKGTARPIHYHVLLNENNAFGPEELQQFIFEHSFQYCRSTTPVSLHPAVYYAHLASNRATAHLNAPVVSSGKKDQKKEGGPPREDHSRPGTSKSGKDKDESALKPSTEIPPLLPLGEKLGMHNVMWFV